MSNAMTFIGGGNMASAIVGGLLSSGRSATDITIVEPDAGKRCALQAEHGVNTTGDTIAACQTATTIILAVKPQVIAIVADSLRGQCRFEDKLLISIAAGVNLDTLESLFGAVPIARTMPNTPALVRLGATGLYTNPHVSSAQIEDAVAIIESFGLCIRVEKESLLDAVTAVAGSGPAYFFLLIEEMINSGVRLGLSEADATALALQTALGASTMAAQGSVSPAELRRRVTSPNGTTHAAITSMQNNQFDTLIDQALTACRDRAVELGKG